MSVIKVDQFAAAIRTKRGPVGLRQVSAEIGDVSATTLSRIEQGRMPDLATFVRVCKWLGKNPNSFIEGDIDFQAEFVGSGGSAGSSPDRVEAFFRAEKTLSPETIGALSQMVRLAYKAAESGSLVSED